MPVGGCEAARTVARLPLVPGALVAMGTNGGTQPLFPPNRAGAPAGPPPATMELAVLRYVSLTEPQLVERFGPPETRTPVADGVDLSWRSQRCRLTTWLGPRGGVLRAVGLTTSNTSETASKECMSSLLASPQAG